MDDEAVEMWSGPFAADEDALSVKEVINHGSVNKLCMYPYSRLVACAPYELFSCKGPIYQILGTSGEEWGTILGSTTHVSLSRGEENEWLIFLRRRQHSVQSARDAKRLC